MSRLPNENRRRGLPAIVTILLSVILSLALFSASTNLFPNYFGGSIPGQQGNQGIQGEKGEQGAKGETGAQGEQGEAGESAYDIAVRNGFVGTEAQWLESLKGKNGTSGGGGRGAQGEKGEDGKTSIELAVTRLNNMLVSSTTKLTPYERFDEAGINEYNFANLADYNLEFYYSLHDNKFIAVDLTNHILLGSTSYAKDSLLTTTTMDLYKFIYNDGDLSDKYSNYLTKAFHSTTLNLSITTGLDVGEHEEGYNITYDRSLAATGQEVVIRTNSANTTLTIIAPNDTINHYDVVGKVDAQKVDMDCYNEYGEASYVKVTEGKVVAKAGGKINTVFANNADGTKVAVIEESGSKIKNGFTTVQDTHDQNLARENGSDLVYSKNGEEPYTETEIEEIGSLAVSADTGVAPENSGYVAVVNNIGYSSLAAAVAAANDGDTVSLLEDTTENTEAGTIAYTSLSAQTPKTAILIDKNITIKGFNHKLKTSLEVALGITSSDISVNVINLFIEAKMSAIQLTEDIDDVEINIEGSELTVTGQGYAFRTGNGTNNLRVTMKNTKVAGYSAFTLRNSNSTFKIVDCDLRGKNEASSAPSNDYAAIVFDGADYSQTPYTSHSPYDGMPGNCGSNNTMEIINTSLRATSETDNSQVWLNMQYGARNNTVIVDALSVISPDDTWHYTEDEGKTTNTIKINGVAISGVEGA